MCRNVLLSAILLCVVISFPAVVGDCHDDPAGNNKSYKNCASCHQTFADALINTGDNKYLLSKTFFPTDFAPPAEVQVTYMSDNNKTKNITFFWLIGGFYAFQPTYIFLYRSLYFSAPIYRQKCVVLTLPDDCFKVPNEFFQYTTQRVSYQQ